ncbi:putative FBD-associated F-box protein At1g61330 [Durio zibethinus]|uniref:FBD-associated F-box protein At1g61330 n=1 Tax=Durio zibethinus TaxID=66656 RepID=A0A6P5X7Y3_DURZI|nr:putative FBD-associated F-box protein At1g61330 [Durio zibethinus]
MAVPGIENLANPRKKNKRENLGDRGHRLRPSNVPSGTDANLVNLAFDVPDDVLTNIFSFLPIKEAVQASTVATRFKQSWFFNRKLCFDKDFAKRHAQKDFLNIVNRVFELHVGQNIQTLRLFFDPTGVEDAVENWIQISIDKEVEELDLNFSLAKDPYRITTDFADFESIKILKLCRCELDLLPTFRGLNSLKTLVLRRIEINSKFLETVFSNCLSLETLELVKCRKIGHLRILAQNLRRFKALKLGDCLGLYQVDIDAPTIRSIHYSGIFILFKFVEISQLNDVILNFKPLKGIEKFFRRDSFLCDLSHIAVLSASNTLLEDLSPEYFHRILRFHFGKLKELQLFMENAVYCNLYHIAYFLKKCPRLEKLFIDVSMC